MSWWNEISDEKFVLSNITPVDEKNMSSPNTETKDPIAEIMSEIEVLHHQAVKEVEEAPKKPPILPKAAAQQKTPLATAPSEVKQPEISISAAEAELAAEFGITIDSTASSPVSTVTSVETPASIASEPPIDLGELAAELDTVQAIAAVQSETATAGVENVTPPENVTNSDAVSSVTNEDSLMADFRSELGTTGGGSEEGSLEDTLGSIKEEESGKASIFDSPPINEEDEELGPIPDPSLPEAPLNATLGSAVDVSAEVIPIRPQASTHFKPEASFKSEASLKQDSTQAGAEGVLSMTLQGKMALNLKYAFEEHEVWISFNEDALKIQLQDGAEFKVPLKKKLAAAQ